ncbi:UTP--glucose-1-phosphate uridylyltransferase GalU [Nonomuraea antimicrobica]|uniref:UTP--glucose-1-phosphate uridylyltransferase n=1 Tax=Nonomuraea antimicrobica TaxID=561173 RepID=A0ABP7BMH9_9ACTN
MIHKAVIPVAGLGSRLLPLTRALPKEMLPIGDRPVIEHTIRELVESGIEEITIVTSGRKHLIQQHFAPDADLELQLRTTGKPELADAVAELSSLARITYLYQDGPYGNGTPVLNAARVIGDEPFMVLWADDVFVAEVPRAKQLKAAYEATRAPVLALMPMAAEDAPRYGVPVVKEDLGQGRLLIGGLVEKPSPERAPSRYAAIGGYVITPGVVDALEARTRSWHENPVGEIYLTDALNDHARTHEVYGQVIDGTWWDTGSPLNYLKAQFAAALAHPDYGPELRKLAQSQDGDPAGT